MSILRLHEESSLAQERSESIRPRSDSR